MIIYQIGTNRPTEVLQQGSYYYDKVPQDNGLFMIYEKATIKEEEIKEGHKYLYYKINNELYEAFVSNDLYLERLKNEPVFLDIFDFLEGEEDEE